MNEPEHLNETPPEIETASTNSTPAPTPPKKYQRPKITTILKMFPPEHRGPIEHALNVIAAATPFTRHPIDAIATAVHRLAADLDRLTLAYDPNTPPDDPNKIIAIAALAAAAKNQIVQPATSRLQRILNDVADLPPEPSTIEDKDDKKARERRQRLQHRLDEIRRAQIRRNTREETAAQKRAEADAKRIRKRRMQEIASMKRRVKERERSRVKNKWER